MPTELILAGNGPGELSGWVLPVARAARALATQTQQAVRLTLALSPSQYAGGREAEVVQQWGVFDRIVDPPQCIRLALGFGHLPIDANTALIHLGGDLWFSARLARRLGIPGCALAETTLIARRHRPFAWVFAVSEALAQRLDVQGVPRQRILVTGDPRADAVAAARNMPPVSPSHPPASSTRRPRLSFLPGSRDHFFTFLVPYFLDTTKALAPSHPGLSVQIVVSSFLSPALVEETKRKVDRRWPDLPVEWLSDQAWAALGMSDLILTIPGTNTVELALAGIPFAVVVPTHEISRMATEGILEWVSRLPGLGRLIKGAVLSHYLATKRFVALPNQKAGRAVVPEWIGRWTPTELANRLAELLDDPSRRATIATALRELYGDPPGASATIARYAVALAEGRLETPP